MEERKFLSLRPFLPLMEDMEKKVTGGMRSCQRSIPRRSGEQKMFKPVLRRIEKDVRIAAPVFIQATKNEALIKILKAEEQKLGEILGWKFKLIERGGRKLTDLLTGHDPFASESCGREDCQS